jgi:protein TonB
MSNFADAGGGSIGAPNKVRARLRCKPSRDMRGTVSAPQLIVIAIVIALIAVALWWFVGRPGHVATAPAVMAGKSAPSVAPTNAPAASAAAVSAAPAAQDLSIDQLYKNARAAMSENRVVAPAGNNALEYYLAIIAKQPDDTSAADALRELFPFATGNAEDQINQGNFDEATRIINLLAKADPSNYTLTILRSKLDAKKKQNDRDAVQQAAATAAAARAQAAAAEAKAAAPAPEAPVTPPPAPKPKPAAPEVAPKPVVEAPAPPPVPVGETRQARVVTPPQPVYPMEAARDRTNGWVVVKFTVSADGAVQNAKVTSSQPARVFDRAALAAISRARFEPALDKGKPVASTLERRIEFKF